MYKNNVQLIGFLGNDAEVRTNDNRSLTRLSLATKSSYKKHGKWIEHTEWHKCVVFGKLGEFAGALKKGAHILVEGEIRSREYDSTKTGQKESVTEIRVDSILKLDRAAKASAEDNETGDVAEDVPAEEVAA
ncbi:single-stranded DNA-binding protein [Terriglobus sp. RCC_193]|uniref:single-stranded DNA-binding protein n=1 Tax=Terriglobus sp. RCC_193 TaxID=3239218 RepID=UPI003523EBA3